MKEKGGRICGISAPSRASTLVNYVGLDSAIIDYVCEIKGSLKIGKCMPGTLIPVVEESRMFEDQPDCAIIFSWHIADELAPKLRAKGYKGMSIARSTRSGTLVGPGICRKCLPVCTVMDGTALLGAVGVSGDTSDNDEACAIAGIEAAGMKANAG